MPQNTPNGQLNYRILEEPIRNVFDVRDSGNQAEIYLVRSLGDIDKDDFRVSVEWNFLKQLNLIDLCFHWPGLSGFVFFVVQILAVIFVSTSDTVVKRYFRSL